MFQFIYSSPNLREKIEDPHKHCPEEVCRELPQFIEALSRDGQISGSDFFRGNINKISAKTFELYYVSNISNQSIKIIEFKVKSLDLLKSRFSLQDSWDDRDVIDIIPQCDSPQKLIRALKLILSGVTDAYELGYELGHRGKKKKYIARHGQYTRQALESLKLVQSSKQGTKRIPELTQRGRKIAETSDTYLQNKLLTIAMLDYPPMAKVVTAITDGEGVFDDATIQEIAFPAEFRDADTCPRRTQTLKAWIRWISSTSGIPIRLPGGTKQLTLPIFGD